MHPKTRFLFTAAMDVDADKEALFNEVYDTEHVPALLKVPGVLAVHRMTLQPLKLAIGGEVKTIAFADEPKYSAIYELESAEVLTSSAWAKAVEVGRWGSQVRPYTKNRRHTLRKIGG
jgi:hypothetical protein